MTVNDVLLALKEKRPLTPTNYQVLVPMVLRMLPMRKFGCSEAVIADYLLRHTKGFDVDTIALATKTVTSFDFNAMKFIQKE